MNQRLPLAQNAGTWGCVPSGCWEDRVEINFHQRFQVGLIGNQAELGNPIRVSR
jgi:hypothetical protein